MSEGWLRKIDNAPAFRFTAKLWRGFTHERNATGKDEADFKEGAAPLLEARPGCFATAIPLVVPQHARESGICSAAFEALRGISAGA